MSSSLIERLSKASRPYKSFEFTISDDDSETFYTRVLSALEADKLTQVFNTEFERVTREMEDGNIDTAMIRRNLARQSPEKLTELILKADNTDFLAEASSDLDDLGWSDDRVIKLAEKKKEEARAEFLKVGPEDLLEAALERRAFIVASLRATDIQNISFLYYALYSEPDVHAFESPEVISTSLDRQTISRLINSVYLCQRGGEVADPLATQPLKPVKKRTKSA